MLETEIPDFAPTAQTKVACFFLLRWSLYWTEWKHNIFNYFFIHKLADPDISIEYTSPWHEQDSNSQ